MSDLFRMDGRVALVSGASDAQWLTWSELLSGFPELPYRRSIARRLVDDWPQRSD